MSELKPGRRAILGYVIDESIQVGDLCWQGPLTLVRGQGTGALFTSADRDVHVIPDVPNLAAVARVLADHGSILTAAVEMAYVDATKRGDRTQLSDALRALAAALNGGTA